MVPKWLNLDYR